MSIVLPIYLMIGIGVSQFVSWYSCPETCVGECVCASSKSPVSNPPQFILLTHDDALTSLSAHTVLNALKGLKNPNGCDLPATFYISIRDSVDYLVHHLFMSNHEIADHTYNHLYLPDAQEIWSGIEWLHERGGVPIDEIRGFRAPYLRHDVAQRQTLYNIGLKYDGSITHRPGRDQLFPYTLDYGVAVDCSVGTGICESNESYPGLWSIPLWTLPESGPMDIQGDVYGKYMNELQTKLSGNRSPLGIFCHSGWLSQNLQTIHRFLSDALAMNENVWVVTNWQLIEWMKDPVSAEHYRAKMTARRFCPRKPRGSLPPSSGCIFGTWDRSLYKCRCQGEGNVNGYCHDFHGSCSIAKTFVNGNWICPGSDNDGKGRYSHSVSDPSAQHYR